MSNDTGQRLVNAKPQTWEQAAEQVTVAHLEEQLRRWLRESGLPGTADIGDEGSSSVADRVKFLKLICGEGE